MATSDKVMNGDHARAQEPEVRPRNWPVPVFLLCLREWNLYGYKLMERAAAFGFGSLHAPTAYRTLRQMERDGLVESSWESSKEGPNRRVYSLTEAGLVYLELWAESLERYRRTTDTFLRLYADPNTRSRDT